MNLKNIDDCDILFGVTDGKDMGTIWECGYANGLNRIRNPWIYLKLSKTPDLPNERMEFHDLQVKYFE